MSGKCPKCDALISHVNLAEVTASSFMGKEWRALSYSCPHCQTVLSVGIDPIALKTDTVNEILKGLGRI